MGQEEIHDQVLQGNEVGVEGELRSLKTKRKLSKWILKVIILLAIYGLVEAFVEL